jgi:arylsulfatase A-like enzyme
MQTPNLFLFFTAVLVTACQPHPKNKEETNRPNVIFIISDDQSWGDYGFMGHPQIQTPHIDQLAKESATYTKGYVTSPLCGPSLASIITGKYAFQHAQTGNDAGDSKREPPLWDENYKGNFERKKSNNYLFSKQRNDLFDIIKSKFYENKLLTDYLSEKGYRSFQSGKWWLGSWKEGKFDAGMTHGDYQKNGRHGDEGLKIGREGLDPIFDFIDKTQEDGTPFFVWYAPFLPHTPHTPPSELLEKYRDLAPNDNVAKYWAMCEWMDQTVGELAQYLKQKNLDKNTLIVYTTDNGWIQSDQYNHYAPRSKRAPHEGGIRTPIMLKLPGVITPKMDHTTLVSNIDLVPTVLGLLNMAEEQLTGINILDHEKLKARKTLFVECYNHDILNTEKPTETVLYKIALDNKWKLMLPNPNMIHRSYTSAQEQYYGYYSHQAQLFDLENDPEEQINLAEKHPEIVTKMSRQINEWWQPIH